MEQRSSIFIIGAQCTGKTTLVEDVASQLQREKPGLSFSVIKELARGMLQTIDITRDDIRAGSEKAMDFQKLILKAQLREELDRQDKGFIISDRSGIDPIAYATLYGISGGAAKEMLESSEWALLREKMRRGIIIVCEPVPTWLFDDGTRLMPKDNNEWLDLHRVFVDLLEQCNLGFEVLRATCVSREERVAVVLDAWEKRNKLS